MNRNSTKEGRQMVSRYNLKIHSISLALKKFVSTETTMKYCNTPMKTAKTKIVTTSNAGVRV